MNKFFLAFASIITPGVWAFTYLKEWVSIKFLGKMVRLQPEKGITYPYFHQSETLYLQVHLIFGTIFLVLCLGSTVFTIRRKWGLVFLCFVLSMLCMFAVMINGAIK